MATDYGTDVSCLPSLDRSFAVISGPQVIAEEVIRRWSTPHGFCGDDPDAGFDLRSKLNQKWDLKSLFDTKNALEREAEKDERVLICSVALSFDQRTKTLNVSGQFDTTEGAFTIVVAADSLSLKVLGIQ